MSVYGDMPEAKRPEPHVVTDIPSSVQQKPRKDVERLLDYIEGPFIDKWKNIRSLNSSIKAVRTQENINNLLIDCNDFRMELDMWIPMAERLYDEAFATAQGVAHASAIEKQAVGKGRTSVQMTKDQAKAETGPLKEAVAQLKATRETMVGLSFATQTQLKALNTDEGLEAAAQSVVVPASRYENAPIGEALHRYISNRKVSKKPDKTESEN